MPSDTVEVQSPPVPSIFMTRPRESSDYVVTAGRQQVCFLSTRLCSIDFVFLNAARTLSGCPTVFVCSGSL